MDMKDYLRNAYEYTVTCPIRDKDGNIVDKGCDEYFDAPSVDVAIGRLCETVREYAQENVDAFSLFYNPDESHICTGELIGKGVVKLVRLGLWWE